jgi:TolA-binding protein
MRLPIALSIAVLAATGISPALAQQNQGTPEQRIDRLEKQLRQVQGRVFVRGQPADTAGFAYEPAATQSSVSAINDRLTALERQMADIQRQSEENGHRLSTIESDVRRIGTDQEQRIAALERRAAEAATAPASDPAPATAVPTTTLPKTATTSDNKPPVATATSTATVAEDPGEDAYTQGFRLWQAGNYSQAITSLKAFLAAYPKHRRVSWANNLIGRSLLDSGQPRAAAEALLANYRSNPKGERAPDSLYYLGQSLMKLGQPSQACKAYAELEDVYGGKIRPDLASLLPSAKSQAGCS